MAVQMIKLFLQIRNHSKVDIDVKLASFADDTHHTMESSTMHEA